MSPLTKKAISDVTHRKLRTTLTVLGIGIGIGGLTAINSASGQVRSSIQFTTDRSVEPDIEFFTLPAEASLAGLLQQQANVKLVQAQTIVPSRWAIPTGHESLNITGIADFADVRFGKFQLAAGRLPGPDEILMEVSARSVTKFGVGDRIELQAQGAPAFLRVSGLTRTPGLPSPSVSGRAFAYMREADLQALFHVPGVNIFRVGLEDSAARDATAKRLAHVLADQHVVVLNVVLPRDQSREGTQLIEGIFGIMRVLSIIALLLSIFLLLSTITTLMTEQVPIIGMLKAIGAGRGQVLRTYLASAVIYGVAGTAIGLVLGIFGGQLILGFFADLETLDVGPPATSPALVLVSVLVGVGVPPLAAVLPVFLGTRITVRHALSGYGLEGGAGVQGRGFARLAGRAFGFLPQTVQLGVRSLFRKRTRAVLTVLALTVAGAAFLAVQATASSFNAVLAQVFSSYHADVFAVLTKAQPYGALQQELAGVPGIAQTEPVFQDAVQTKWGTGLLTGVLPDARLYERHVVSGRWFSGGDQDGALISVEGAAKSGLKVGDHIDFHNSLYSAHWRIIGIIRDYNGLIGVGVLVTSLSQANRFDHLPADFVQQVMIRSASSNQKDIDTLAKRVDETLGRAGIPAFVVTAQQQIQRNQSQFLVLYVLFYSVVVIIALVGAIGLFNTLAMSVLERQREIGILRSMGATGRKVAQAFWTEGIALSVVAWLVAVVVGIPAAYGFVQLLGQLIVTVPFAFNPLSLVVMLAFIVVVASVASLGPVWGATRVKVAQTLRYE